MPTSAVRAVRLTKRGHACLELDCGSGRIIVDPGVFGEPPRVDGAAAILVSHGHFDHASRTLLEEAATAGVPIYGPPDLTAQLGSGLLGQHVQAVRPGDHIDLAGCAVTLVGGQHAPVHPERPGPANLAFLIDDRILVTGDEHPAVDVPVEVLITPVDAPWLRAVDLIDYVRRIRPRLVIGVHDGLLNADGLAVADAVLASLTREGADEALRLDPGQQLVLGVAGAAG